MPIAGLTLSVSTEGSEASAVADSIDGLTPSGNTECAELSVAADSNTDEGDVGATCGRSEGGDGASFGTGVKIDAADATDPGMGGGDGVTAACDTTGVGTIGARSGAACVGRFDRGAAVVVSPMGRQVKSASNETDGAAVCAVGGSIGAADGAGGPLRKT